MSTLPITQSPVARPQARAHSRTRSIHYAAVLFLALILATSYHFNMAQWSYEQTRRYTIMSDDIVNGTAPSPYRYRVLAPFAAELLSRTVNYPLHEGRLLIAYSILHMVVFPAMLLALYSYVSSMTNANGGLIAVGIVFAIWPLITASVYWPMSIYAPIEMLLLTLVLHYRNRPGLVAVFLLLAVLNRETAVFAVLAYGAAHWPEKRRISLAFLITTILIIAGLRLGLGLAEHESKWFTTFTAELGSLWTQILIFNAFLLPLWYAAWNGRNLVSDELRRIAAVSIVYFGFLLTFASLREVRLYLTSFVLVAPLIVAFIQAQLKGETSK